MLESVQLFASWGCLALGAFFVLTSAIGLLRMPDFFSRLHPAGIVDSMGVMLICLGLIIQAGLTFMSLKIALLALFLLVTSPTACHALAQSARVLIDKDEQPQKEDAHG